MLTGILQVGMGKLPPQCTFWRFLTSLPVTVAQQLLKLQRLPRERVWEAANVQLPSITLDTDTTVHTLYGRQMGARKSYNPKNKGKKSYQPILTFVAETREYIGGELRNGDRPTGAQIARHVEAVRCGRHRHRATVMLAYIQLLYEIEREARQGNLNPEQRRELRQTKSRPILEDIKNYLQAEKPKVLPKSAIGEAIDYTLSNWEALLVTRKTAS